MQLRGLVQERWGVRTPAAMQRCILSRIKSTTKCWGHRVRPEIPFLSSSASERRTFSPQFEWCTTDGGPLTHVLEEGGREGGEGQDERRLLSYNLHCVIQFAAKKIEWNYFTLSWATSWPRGHRGQCDLGPCPKTRDTWSSRCLRPPIVIRCSGQSIFRGPSPSAHILDAERNRVSIAACRQRPLAQTARAS